nr:MAG TPA: Phosphoethanolamine N-methyltransferase-like protein [Caudoviricetes sp.]
MSPSFWGSFYALYNMIKPDGLIILYNGLD